ncbi:MAG: nicotinate-nicotinamide nucleotide adenylyltransferase [Alphaproteobacteria bacterium]|nr:nicotinate-nicotinamide nucleotide adenylyltransferase [Alphaproteobacteria bacterium]
MAKRLAGKPVRLPGPYRGLTIGLVGGAFDPPHEGHQHVVEIARKRLRLDWIWVTPASDHPFKPNASAYPDRVRAAREALSGPRTRIAAIEGALGVTCTRDLLAHLKRRAPGARFIWIMGADNAISFHRWKAWKAIASQVPIAIVSRPGASPKAGLSRLAREFSGARLAQEQAGSLSLRRPPAWIYLSAPLNPASSTRLRITPSHGVRERR